MLIKDMPPGKQCRLSITVTNKIQRFQKNPLISLKSYPLFGVWTTLVENTDWCLWFSLFKYVQYVDHYQVVCLLQNQKLYSNIWKLGYL